MQRKVTGAEVIATYLGWDVAEMREHRYQSTRFNPAVYTCPDDYYCCPPTGKQPPKNEDFNWVIVNDEYISKRFPDRVIYVCKMKRNVDNGNIRSYKRT